MRHVSENTQSRAVHDCSQTAHRQDFLLKTRDKDDITHLVAEGAIYEIHTMLEREEHTAHTSRAPRCGAGAAFIQLVRNFRAP